MKIAITSGPWSEPATWGGTSLPAEDDDVMIDHGVEVTLDTSPPPLGGINVHGTLRVRVGTPIQLTADWIMVHGLFEAGKEENPIPHSAPFTLTLTGAPGQVFGPGGNRFLMAHDGGTIELHGYSPGPTWAMAIGYMAEWQGLVDSPVYWPVGAEVIITSTDPDPNHTEKKTLAWVQPFDSTGEGGPIHTYFNWNAALVYPHNVQKLTIPHNNPLVSRTIDVRAEVALLSHPIKIQGAEDSEQSQFGAHVMVMGTNSKARIEGVEFYRCGQFGRLGRYPIHWHDVNEGGANSYLRNCAVHRSYNRAVTIHKTSFMSVSYVVAYDIIGHAFFLEDGKEIRNRFFACLGALVHDGPLDGRSGVAGGFPSVFWISNPNNDFERCVAAGADGSGIGFWYNPFVNPRPGSISEDPNYFCHLQPFGVFKDNRIHSINRVNPGDLGGWGVGLDMDNGGTLYLEGTTIFGASIVAFYSGQVQAIGGNVIFDRSQVNVDFVMFKGNTLLRNSLCVATEGATGAVLMNGYDGTPNAENCVLKGYHNMVVQPGHRPLSIPINLRWLTVTDCYITNNPYLSPDRFVFLMSDPDDMFGNGSPGTFVNQDYALSGPTSTLGVHPDDPYTKWSPGVFAGITIQYPNAQITVNGTGQMAQADGGAMSVGAFELNVPYNLTFNWGVAAPPVNFWIETVSSYAKPTDLLRLIFTAPPGLNAVYLNWQTSPAVATLADWYSSQGPAWFLDPQGVLYLALQTQQGPVPQYLGCFFGYHP